MGSIILRSTRCDVFSVFTAQEINAIKGAVDSSCTWGLWHVRWQVSVSVLKQIQGQNNVSSDLKGSRVNKAMGKQKPVSEPVHISWVRPKYGSLAASLACVDEQGGLFHSVCTQETQCSY